MRMRNMKQPMFKTTKTKVQWVTQESINKLHNEPSELDFDLLKAATGLHGYVHSSYNSSCGNLHSTNVHHFTET